MEPGPERVPGKVRFEMRVHLPDEVREVFKILANHLVHYGCDHIVFDKEGEHFTIEGYRDGKLFDKGTTEFLPNVPKVKRG